MKPIEQIHVQYIFTLEAYNFFYEKLAKIYIIKVAICVQFKCQIWCDSPGKYFFLYKILISRDTVKLQCPFADFYMTLEVFWHEDAWKQLFFGYCFSCFKTCLLKKARYVSLLCQEFFLYLVKCPLLHCELHYVHWKWIFLTSIGVYI